MTYHKPLLISIFEKIQKKGLSFALCSNPCDNEPICARDKKHKVRRESS
jgi:hypothetical protein